MSAADNTKTIEAMYAAFGRGDVEAILASLTDDVDWATDTESSAAPWYGVRHGKDAVVDFFQQFGSSMEVEEFTPTTYAANEDSVHTIVRCRAKSRVTGKVADMSLHHYFRFRDGAVCFYRGTEDTFQVEAALKG